MGRRKDGTEFPAEIVLSPIETEDEVLIAAAVRDVTHRQATEAALRTHLQIQATLIALLELSLQPMSLPEQMERVLDCLLDVPWMELESKGAVFLVEEGTSELTMIAQRGLSAGVRECLSAHPVRRASVRRSCRVASHRIHPVCRSAAADPLPRECRLTVTTACRFSPAMTYSA